MLNVKKATAVIFGTKDETLAIGRPGRLRLVRAAERRFTRVGWPASTFCTQMSKFPSLSHA